MNSSGVRRLGICLGTALTCVLCGCKTVEFQDARSGKNTGFEYYPAKPYLLVRQTEKGQEVSAISLPDLTNPRAVKEKGEFGSVEMGFQVSNGMITQYNGKTDTKTPETLATLATAATAVATYGAAGLTAAGAVTSSKYAASSDILTAILGGLNPEVSAEDGKSFMLFSENEDVPPIIKTEAVNVPVLELQAVRESIASAIEKLDALPADKNPLPTSKEQLKKVLDDVDDNIAVNVSYEIRQVNGKVQIRFTNVEDIPELYEQRSNERRSQLKKRGVMPRLRDERSVIAAVANNPGDFPESFAIAMNALRECDEATSMLSQFLGVSAGYELYEIVPRGNDIAFVRAYLDVPRSSSK